MVEPEIRAGMIREALRIEEDCSYSAKGHYETARMWGRWNLALGIPAALLAALAGASAFSDQKQLAGALALFGGALTAILTFLKPNEKASVHHRTGSLYNSLRSRTRFFREVEFSQVTDMKVLTKKLRQLVSERNELNEVSPEIPRPAFERAREGISSGEARHQVDEPTSG